MDEARRAIARHARDEAGWLMTVVGASPCIALPHGYVICCCDRDHCLVHAIDATFPRLSVVPARTSAPARPARVLCDHGVAVVVGLPAMGAWLTAFATYRNTAARIALQLALLLGLAALGGSVIADPSMWRFLHWPSWPYNEDFAVLLPLAALSELLALTALAMVRGWWTRRGGGIAAAVASVLPALVGFQFVHLLRFLSVRCLLDVLPTEGLKVLFWAWDPVAYLVLVAGLLTTPSPVRTRSA